MGGSSPLTRGKRLAARRRESRPRLIPAHAGKTTRPGPSYGRSPAHPRSRGENLPRFRVVGVEAGSSPLTRGKQDPGSAQNQQNGLIPAHAGKTRGLQRVQTLVEAHPRSRGENGGLHYQGLEGGGSSPLTRGKHANASMSGMLSGLIPAHAGKTRPRSRPCPSQPAHPRSRGENSFDRSCRCTAHGSSPLTRGKLSDELAYEHNGGLIPAHAGKTHFVTRQPPWAGAHPRSRGENARSAAEAWMHAGSSPLTRGKPIS